MKIPDSKYDVGDFVKLTGNGTIGLVREIKATITSKDVSFTYVVWFGSQYDYFGPKEIDCKVKVDEVYD